MPGTTIPIGWQIVTCRNDRPFHPEAQTVIVGAGGTARRYGPRPLAAPIWSHGARFAQVLLKQRVAAKGKYIPLVVRGKSNRGTCLACDHGTLFVETGPWLANDYLCARCGSIPRWRGMVHVLNTQFPNWRDLQIHECGAGGQATTKFMRETRGGYSGSQYLIPEVPRGSRISDALTCQNIEDMTFADDSFDLFITQDVLEHVLQPERAMAEIARVLRPGGAHVFTVPIYHGRKTLVRVAPNEGEVEYLLPPEYHGGEDDPDRSLVIREWGDDFVDFASEHGGFSTEALILKNRRLGLDGNPGYPLQVFVSRPWVCN